MPSYVSLVNSPLVLNPVVQRLGLRESSGVIAQRIQASNPLETALIDISVRDRSPQRAYDLGEE